MFDKSENAELTPAQQELETTLRQIRPATHRIDRDRMMFAAGVASVTRRINWWRAAAAVLVVGNAVALSFALHRRQASGLVAVSEKVAPAPQVVSDGGASSADATTKLQFALTTGSEPREPLLPATGRGYVSMRDAVLRYGVSALPAEVRTSSSIHALNVAELLGSPPPRETRTAPWSSLATPLQKLFSGEQL